MEFTRDDIRRQFDPGTFARGEEYARKDRVIEIALDGDRIHGEVQGSGRNRYQQTIRVKSDKRGVRFSGDCSCPMTRNCKHVVSVLLTGLERGAADVPAAAARWLERLAALQNSLRNAESAPSDDTLRLVMADWLDENGQPERASGATT